jgi:putative ABC transport system substrate-binding protein
MIETPMRRRDFIALLSAAAGAYPLVASAQAPVMPLIGFLNSASPEPAAPFVAAFRRGLDRTGYVDGRNVVIEYRWAEGQYDRLPALTEELIRRKVAVIAATGGLITAQVAKVATSTIPVLFIAGFDPVKEGLVASMNRPGGNATGVSVYTTELGAKRLEQLRELLPGLAKVAALVNPHSILIEVEKKDLEAAGRIAGIELFVVEASSANDFEKAFSDAVNAGANALIVPADPFFTSRRSQLVALASRYRLPATYPWSQYVDVGGLMSYGPTLTWAYEEIGAYAGRILKGTKPDALPVQLPTTFEMAINLNTAKSLGLSIPPFLLARADRVVE